MRIRHLLVGTALCLLAIPNNDAKSYSCYTGPYIIFFEKDSAFIDSESRKILDYGISAAENCHGHHPQIAGHTDTTEAVALGQTRVDVVKQYLMSRGFPSADIVSENFGASAPRKEDVGQVEEPANRRVELMFWHKRQSEPDI